jgi:hypothetical protein
MPRQSRSNGRSSGFGSRSSSSSSRSASPNTNYSRPQQQQPTYQAQGRPPMQAPSGGGMMSGIGSTIVQGMAFGGGSEIGHQAVRALMGGGSHSHAPQQQNPQPVEQNTQPQQQKQSPCSDYNFRFVDCLKVNDNNISSCQSLFDDLKSCEKSLI